MTDEETLEIDRTREIRILEAVVPEMRRLGVSILKSWRGFEIHLGPEPIDHALEFNKETQEAAVRSDPPKTHEDGLTAEQQEEHYGRSY